MVVFQQDVPPPDKKERNFGIPQGANKNPLRKTTYFGNGTLGALVNFVVKIAEFSERCFGILGAAPGVLGGTLGALERDFRGALYIYSCMYL